MEELVKRIYLKLQLQRLPKWLLFALFGTAVLCFYQIYLNICYLTNEARKGSSCADCSNGIFQKH